MENLLFITYTFSLFLLLSFFLFFLFFPPCTSADFFRKQGVHTPSMRRLFEAVTMTTLTPEALDALTEEDPEPASSVVRMDRERERERKRERKRERERERVLSIYVC